MSVSEREDKAQDVGGPFRQARIKLSCQAL
jgi:hypothetical protein